jgi:hypothetical protein
MLPFADLLTAFPRTTPESQLMKIARTDFHGVDAIELTTEALRLVVVTGFGPRIAHLSPPDGENMLLWDTDGKYVRGDWNLRGGHRVWATRPLADECEDTYAADNNACTVEEHADGFTVTSAVDPTNRTQRGITVRVSAFNRLTVDNFLINTSEMLYSCGLWALTCTLPGDGVRYFVPLGDGSAWDACRIVLFRTWGGHDGGFADDQFEITDELFTINPAGRENKRMLMAQRGLMALSDPGRGVTFTKQIAHDPAGRYPMDSNMAFYVGPDNFMVEMETMGPEKTVPPGASIHHEEVWTLRDTAVAPEDWQQLFD